MRIHGAYVVGRLEVINGIVNAIVIMYAPDIPFMHNAEPPIQIQEDVGHSWRGNINTS
jgi:hypothetical protein